MKESECSVCVSALEQVRVVDHDHWRGKRNQSRCRSFDFRLLLELDYVFVGALQVLLDRTQDYSQAESSDFFLRLHLTTLRLDITRHEAADDAIKQSCGRVDGVVAKIEPECGVLVVVQHFPQRLRKV